MTPQDAALLASLTGFTPGPHIAEGQSVYVLHSHPVGQRANRSLAYVGSVRTCRAELEANARLYAAAPDLHRIATEQAVEIERLRSNLAQVVDALGMAIKVYDDADLASAEPVEATDAINYCRVILQFHSKAVQP